MASPIAEKSVLRLFADILEYPKPGLAEAVGECAALVSPESPEAATLLREFRAFVEKAPPGRLEEVYTGSFDLDATCHPYVGYHLFGESYKRSAFLVGLQERYQAAGFAVRGELPDHLGVLLSFLATSDDAGLARELINEALLPALKRMVGEGEGEAAADQPKRRSARKGYRPVLQALQLVLQGNREAPHHLGLERI